LVGQFPPSGGAPPQLVGAGEYAIGVAYVHALARYRADGFPVSTVVPPDTVGEVGALAIIANGPNPEGARAFVDFVLSAEAQTAFAAQSFTTPLNPDAAVPEGAPPRDSFDMIDYDAELAGEQRDEGLLRWQQGVDCGWRPRPAAPRPSGGGSCGAGCGTSGTTRCWPWATRPSPCSCSGSWWRRWWRWRSPRGRPTGRGWPPRRAGARPRSTPSRSWASPRRRRSCSARSTPSPSRARGCP